MKKCVLFLFLLFAVLCTIQASSLKSKNNGKPFLKVKGQDIVTPNGESFLIQGINLGNWLNPEGYMFLFKDVSSYRLIDQAFREMVGPDFTDQFWKTFKDNYITREDIAYIKQTGMNSIRLPFHYKLFTDEDYMGLKSNQDGFARVDSVIKWCKAEGLYVILDMHDAPGGQTGDNIDDSYGYPWLFESETSKQLFSEIWKKIADRYKNEPTVLGYDLLNEPIATYFTNKEEINKLLVPVYKRGVEAIRSVDPNHIILLGGAQWNSNFSMFDEKAIDSNMLYTCHRYWCDTLQSNLQDFIDFRNKVNLPLYMGETGENTDEWVGGFRRLMERNNMGWHFWPYKKLEKTSCMVHIKKPANWDLIVEYTQKPRNNFNEIRAARPDQELVKKAMLELLENIKFAHCIKNQGYIKALGMKP
ncbi:glycoside hydrolase family 5 protein [Macellibacteroides fermentans]|jgi:aryl-phospho-beta-D-glucosidase BglC (GH1 family)|uniref:glycoside hydrolase family 5 protein n=1 Tax=Macellibacteroides fermentans TaxID=879969 RepID=UPI000B17DCDB|nr:glycosyl hydrolase family 5 [Porphyromonadaceae bacterium]HNP91585.1 glycoside hydrolase family 5 protein [Macellibacteroides fermentans]HNU36915.1 glycoside hydrolase family 5 protein [Macellibacteroides fermentans]HRG12499.1 glycoside hydrolase family 5 protein [Macellibacteroides fermentans]